MAGRIIHALSSECESVSWSFCATAATGFFPVFNFAFSCELHVISKNETVDLFNDT